MHLLAGASLDSSCTDVSVRGATHLRVKLVPYSSTGRETLYSDWYPIGTYLLDDIDVSFLAGYLTEKVTLDELCVTVEERARILRIPDATPSTSTHAATEACLSASNTRAALTAIAAVVGGAAIIGAITHYYIGDDPNADSVSKVAGLPEAAGSGIRPPTSCLSDAQKASIEQELRDGNWIQNHHIATKYGIWKQLFVDTLAEYDYAAGKGLDGSWNIIEQMPHKGTHPPAYHFWVYRNFEKALRESTSWDEFVAKFKEWVRNPTSIDPTIVRWDWWRCP